MPSASTTNSAANGGDHPGLLEECLRLLTGRRERRAGDRVRVSAMPSTYASDSEKARPARHLGSSRPGADDDAGRIGTIGSTHGVSDSREPRADRRT